MRARLAAVLASALLVAQAAPAEAQGRRSQTPKTDPKMVEAKRLFDQGAEFYSKGDYENAIDSWEQSYAMSHKPLIFESIANAYERLGQPKRAREYLLKWREAAPQDELDVLDTRIKNLDARIAREDQQEAARKADEERLRKDREKNGAEPVPPQGPTPDRPKPESKPFVPGYAMAIGGATLFVLGITLDIVAAARRPDASTACAQTTQGKELCLASAKDSIRASNTLAVLGDVAWIGGALVGASGVALVFVYSKPAGAAQGTTQPIRPATSFAPLVTSGGGGISVRRSF